MAPDIARRRAMKDAYVAQHGGPPSRLDRLLEDAARHARLRGPMPSVGFALALAGVFETCRVRDIAPGVLLEALVDEGRLALLWREVRRWPIATTPAFPAPAWVAPVPRAMRHPWDPDGAPWTAEPGAAVRNCITGERGIVRGACFHVAPGLWMVRWSARDALAYYESRIAADDLEPTPMTDDLADVARSIEDSRDFEPDAEGL